MQSAPSRSKEAVNYDDTIELLQNWEKWERSLQGERLSIKSRSNFTPATALATDKFRVDDAEMIEEVILKWKNSYDNAGGKMRVKVRDVAPEYKAISATKDCEYSRRQKTQRKNGFKHEMIPIGTLMFKVIRAYCRYESDASACAEHIGISTRQFTNLKQRAIECTHFILHPQDMAIAKNVVKSKVVLAS